MKSCFGLLQDFEKEYFVVMYIYISFMTLTIFLSELSPLFHVVLLYYRHNYG